MTSRGHAVKSFDFNIETYHAVADDLKEYWTYYKGYQWMDNSHFENYIYPNIIGKNIPTWLSKILAENPDIVGISVTHSPSGKALAKAIRAADPKIKIVIGGPSCSKYFNDTEKVPGPYYDAVVHNEGEITFSELVDSYVQMGEFQPVLGASVLDKEGQVVFTGDRPVVMDLDQFPTPDFDDFDFSKYIDADNPQLSEKEIPYFGSRGCPARCNFCMDYKMWDLRYRQKSPARIVEEMEYLSKRYGSKQFMLVELIFNGHIPKMRELTQELVRRQLDFTFWGHGRIDPRMDRETLQTLKDAGFRMFIFGLESASDPVLKAMRKGYTAATADRVLTDMGEIGIDCCVNIIVGFPGETWEDYRKTLRFIYKHRKTIAVMPGISACNAMPGSDIFIYPEKFGIKNEIDLSFHVVDWETIDGTNTLNMRNFRKEFMLEAFKKMKFKYTETGSEDFDFDTLPDPELEYLKTKRKSFQKYWNPLSWLNAP